MLAISLTAAVIGVDAHLVRVEADTATGFPKFTMVGLPDSAVRESEGRIRAALRNCGFPFKWDRRITVNLAPASLRKVGSSFDLATAIGLLAADGLLPSDRLADLLLVGELALDGSIRPVCGVLPIALAARRLGIRHLLVPSENAAEAALVPEVTAYPVVSLPHAAELAATQPRPAVPVPIPQPDAPAPPQPDLADVRGQLLARRAVEIAAAGGHNLLLIGPPGAGKTMLARRLPGLLPPLSAQEAVETTAIHSAWGIRLDNALAQRPFRNPHHTASDIALVGGGSALRPGEVSLAHNGILFLDELPEFKRTVLEALREPLEDGTITVARARGTFRFPARFQLAAAMNPCPCGNRGSQRHSCVCTPRQVRAYRDRISGPLLDRIDLHVEVPALAYSEMSACPGEPSAAVAARVRLARRQQIERVGPQGPACNAALSPTEARRFARPDAEAEHLLASAIDRMGLSGRAHDRLLRVARTVADLDGSDRVRTLHVAEALQFRRCKFDTETSPGSWSRG